MHHIRISLALCVNTHGFLLHFVNPMLTKCSKNRCLPHICRFSGCIHRDIQYSHSNSFIILICIVLFKYLYVYRSCGSNIEICSLHIVDHDTPSSFTISDHRGVTDGEFQSFQWWSCRINTKLSTTCLKYGAAYIIS